MSSKSTKAKSKLSGRLVRLPYQQVYDAEIEESLNVRKQLKIRDENFTDVTPHLLDMDMIRAYKFRKLNKAIKLKVLQEGRASSLGSQSTSSRTSILKVKLGGLKLSLEDIVTNIGSLQNILRTENDGISIGDLQPIENVEHKYRFIKITLRKTEDILLYEASSATVPKGTEAGDFVEEDNKIYDYLTIGRGMARRRSDAETQTPEVFTKTRFVNTYYKKFEEKASYASFFDVYDIYKNLSKPHPDTKIERERRLSAIIDPQTFIKQEGKKINENAKFRFSSMVIERLLAGNVYKNSQQRFRNVMLPTKMDPIAEYRYKPNVLFVLNTPLFEGTHFSGKTRKAVSDISFCYGNGDIMAVGYGVFSYSALITVSTGNVCIWSIKNPKNPERSYSYSIPVTAVEFSPYLHFLLAIGMFDGTVEVRNITMPNSPPIAVTQHSTSLNREPVIAIKWFKEQQNKHEIDPLLALSLNGEVWKYCIIRSPMLLGFRQMKLQRVEGVPEGLRVQPPTNDNTWYANRHPLGLNITLHPRHTDIYYLLTDEGCVYKCSTNHTHSYLEVVRAQEGAVNYMDFSPWSPKLFLTCGNDWCIRIWIDGIFKPLVTLKHKMYPYFVAQWSRTHSTIILAMNRVTLDIWDIRRNILTPISCTQFYKSFNTMFRFSLCGHNMATGNERGDVIVCALEDMPFPPHFQYDELRKALFGAISSSPELKNELNSIGFFGYSQKGFRRPP